MPFDVTWESLTSPSATDGVVAPCTEISLSWALVLTADDDAIALAGVAAPVFTWATFSPGKTLRKRSILIGLPKHPQQRALTTDPVRRYP